MVIILSEGERKRGGAGESGEEKAASREGDEAESNEEKHEGGLKREVAFVDDLEPGREEHERDEGEEEKPSEVGALLRVAGGAAGTEKE